MGARSGAVLDRTPRVKRLRIREDFDDSACHRPAQPIARRHDRRPSIGRPASRSACIHSARRSAACRGARTGADGRSGSPAPAAPQVLTPGNSPLYGRPEGNADRRQAGAGRASADPGGGRQAADRPAQAAAWLPHRSLCQRHRQHALAAHRRQGHRVRRHPLRQQGHRHRQEGRQDRDQDRRGRPLSPERSRLQERHALHRRAVADFQDRQCRGPARQAAEADGDLQGSAEGRGAWLEVHRHRSRQQALSSGRPAGQQRAARQGAWSDPPHQSRWHRRAKSSRAACATRSASTGIR